MAMLGIDGIYVLQRRIAAAIRNSHSDGPLTASSVGGCDHLRFDGALRRPLRRFA